MSGMFNNHLDSCHTLCLIIHLTLFNPPVKRLYKFTDRNREKRNEELNKKRMSDYI